MLLFFFLLIPFLLIYYYFDLKEGQRMSNLVTEEALVNKWGGSKLNGEYLPFKLIFKIVKKTEEARIRQFWRL